MGRIQIKLDPHNRPHETIHKGLSQEKKTSTAAHVSSFCWDLGGEENATGSTAEFSQVKSEKPTSHKSEKPTIMKFVLTVHLFGMQMLLDIFYKFDQN